LEIGRQLTSGSNRDLFAAGPDCDVLAFGGCRAAPTSTDGPPMTAWPEIRPIVDGASSSATAIARQSHGRNRAMASSSAAYRGG
jgi:hypothetical protein